MTTEENQMEFFNDDNENNENNKNNKNEIKNTENKSVSKTISLTKKVSTKLSEQDKTLIRELIKENAIDLFNKRKGMTQNSIIKAQKKFIHSFNTFNGKNKTNKTYKTINILNNYFCNPNKLMAEQIFWNTI